MSRRLTAIVLGSAAGGGVPQWNCRCSVCRLVWDGSEKVLPRTQSSIAVSADGESWLLLDASPDLRQQIIAQPALQPKSNGRNSPISAVLVTSGDVDHVAGLLTLRERQPFVLVATSDTLSTIDDNPIFTVLADECVKRRTLRFDETTELLPGLFVSIFAVPGKVALWREQEELAKGELDTKSIGETTIGVSIIANGARLIYVPGCAAMTDDLQRRCAGADVLLFDGTLYDDQEMIREGLGPKTGRRMGHMPISGADGTIAMLSSTDVARRILIHLNNTNPVLIENSAERREIEAQGWDLAFDGMEIAL